MKSPMVKEQIYYVKGMHCAACEVLIEKKILAIPGVRSVDASTAAGRVTIEYDTNTPGVEQLNGIFKEDNYSFFTYEHGGGTLQKSAGEKPINKTLLGFVIANAVVIAFLLLDSMGVSGLLNVSSSSSLLAFFGFGLLAGLSSCAALVGGMVLSMAKQWQRLYASESSAKQFQPHLLFNVGRILSYGFFGGLLGAIGGRLQLSVSVASFLVIAISFIMIALGMQMLGVTGFRKFQISMPKFITQKIANENNFNGKYMPFAMGALTFFLPCGFTITAQSLALLSGSYAEGALIMGAFALGTAPMLLFIGLSSVKFLAKPHLATTFSKAAGFLLLFFALFNINAQYNVLGVNLGNVFAWAGNQSVPDHGSGLASVVDGKQLIKMTVYGTHYNPGIFTVKVGMPVRWEITSSGEPGCDSGAVVANGLLDSPIYLNPNQGQVTVKEFTPQAPGRYQFSCTMGMVRGVIEVVE